MARADQQEHTSLATTDPAPKPVAAVRVPTPAAGEPRTVRLGRSLGWLFAAMFLPLLALGTAIPAFQWDRQRDLAHARLLDEARGLRLAVEREWALDEAVGASTRLAKKSKL